MHLNTYNKNSKLVKSNMKKPTMDRGKVCVAVSQLNTEFTEPIFKYK